ncbi:hypothetical protein OPV22_034811 [Ensete ventricosum]|uniref:Uncharacterized protein n=1 Tax=Ensete ventricosum TaxID=4639 RepID=A0AAV8PI37_ENSVE|nr:hypothetical protein OPV22_034811 [Ensete ventricosum]
MTNEACSGGTGERSVVCTITLRIAGKVLPFASFRTARRSLGRPKTASFGPFLGRFRVPRRPLRAVRNVSHLSTLEPPGWHRGGWGFRIAGKVPPVASFALRRSPLAARSGGRKRPVLACFSAVFACCGGRGERSSGRGIGVAGKVLPFASFAVRRSPLARVAKNGQFWPVFGPFSRAAAIVASGAKRQPSQHPGTPRVAQGWMGLSYSREGAARRFVRSPPLAARSGGPKRPVLACFWAVFACRGGRGERSSGRGIRAAGKVLPFASFAVRRKTASFGLFLGRFRVPRRPQRAVRNVSHLSTLEPPGWHRGGWGFRIAGKVPPVASFALRRSPLARAAQNGQFWPVFGPFSRAAVGAVSGRLDVAFVQQGRCCPSLRSPSVARRSLGRPKTASFGLFLGRFRVPRRPQRAVRNVSHLSTLEPPGWHRGGWGFRIAGKVPPVASFALRRSPLARATQNGQFWPVFGPF